MRFLQALIVSLFIPAIVSAQGICPAYNSCALIHGDGNYQPDFDDFIDDLEYSLSSGSELVSFTASYKGSSAGQATYSALTCERSSREVKLYTECMIVSGESDAGSGSIPRQFPGLDDFGSNVNSSVSLGFEPLFFYSDQPEGENGRIWLTALLCK